MRDKDSQEINKERKSPHGNEKRRDKEAKQKENAYGTGGCRRLIDGTDDIRHRGRGEGGGKGRQSRASHSPDVLLHEAKNTGCNERRSIGVGRGAVSSERMRRTRERDGERERVDKKRRK